MPETQTHRVRATFRASGNRATIKVACLNGEMHTLRLDRDTILFDSAHDRDLDSVMAALGADPHPCAVAENSVMAARLNHAALTGKSDVPNLRRGNRFWSDGHACPGCSQWNRQVVHISSIYHQADRVKGDPDLAKKILRWLTRMEPAAALPSAYASRHQTIAYRAPSALLTLPFVNAARLITPRGEQQPFTVMELRDNGIRVQWLTALTSRLTPEVRAKFQNETTGEPLRRALVAARNVPARTVARYLNAGITSHFHTYARVEATPEQILTVYRNTNGQRTLADYLTEGLSIPTAIQRSLSSETA